MADQPSNISPNRQPSATELPLAGNNFTQASYSFIFTNSKNVITELTLVVNPEEFQQTESSTSTVILTAGDVFSDTYGPGLTRIRISGTFGQRPSAGSGSGQLEALKLRQFFRKYLDEVNPITTGGATGPARNYGAKLQFFNPKDNEFWDIEIPGEYLTLRRSKSSPFLYRYDLNFIAMTPSTQTGLYDVLQQITGAVNNVGTINSNFTQTLTDAATYTQEIATISTSIGLGATYFPNQVLAPLTNLAQATTNFVNGASQVINFPLAGVDQLIASCVAMLVSIENNYDLYISGTLMGQNNGFQYNPNIDNLLVSTIQNCAYLQLYQNSFVKNYIKSDFSTQTSAYDLNLINVDLSNVTSVIYGKVIDGDTIESLAIKGMGDVSMWKTLAEFNNLVYPFIYTGGGVQPEKTLGIGMNIAFPQFGTVNPSGLVLGASGTGPDTTDLSFGTDFYLDSTNDIVFLPNGDIQTISGLSNLMQAITIKFNVMQGELITHLNFGLPNLLGYRTLSFISALAISSIKSTVLSDSRIQSISNVQVSIQDDIINYSCEILPNFTSTPIVLEGTIGGNSLTT